MEHISRGSRSQRIGFVLGPVLFFTVLLLDLDPASPSATPMAAVALLMAVWWITDAVLWFPRTP